MLKDLNEPDDSKRTLKEIDDPSVDDIFEIFKLENPKCDKNNDGVVSGEELKCFGKIWKNFVPNGWYYAYKIIINMNLIYRNCPNSKSYLCIKLILITLTIVDSTLMHSLQAEFSVVYIQMIKEVRNENEWWKTCRMVQQ